jgi:hypothetical protein
MDQQAPPAILQAAPVVFQELSINAQLTSGGIVCHKKYTVTMVKNELKTELNRLALNHPITPTLVTGGFISVLTWASSMGTFISPQAPSSCYTSS